MITEAEVTQTYTYESLSDYCQVENLPPDTIENSNYLIHTPVSKPELATYLYDKATGMKTGTLENILPPGATEYIKSYGCLVASASDGSLNLIAVIFGDLSVGDKETGVPNAYARWDIAKYLFDYGFANYAKVDLAQFAAPVALTEQTENFAANDPEEGSLEVTADLTGVKSDTQLLDAATVQGLQDGSIKLEEKPISIRRFRRRSRRGSKSGQSPIRSTGRNYIPRRSLRGGTSIPREKRPQRARNMVCLYLHLKYGTCGSSFLRQLSSRCLLSGR